MGRKRRWEGRCLEGDPGVGMDSGEAPEVGSRGAGNSHEERERATRAGGIGQFICDDRLSYNRHNTTCCV